MKEQKANSSSQRSPAVFYFAIAVLILVVITTNCTGGLFARYASYGDSSDSARVARFEINQSLKSSNVDLVAEMSPGDEKVVVITVTNNSEVAINYTIQATNITNNLPLSFEPCSHDIQAGENADVEFTIYWDATNDYNRSETFSGKLDLLRLTIYVQQID